MPQYRLLAPAFIAGRLMECGTTIDLEEGVAPPARAVQVPGGGIVNEPLAVEVVATPPAAAPEAEMPEERVEGTPPQSVTSAIAYPSRAVPGPSPLRSSDGRFEYLAMGCEPATEAAQVARFGFQCPRGRGMCTGLLLTTPAGVQRGSGAPCWDWDGNIDAPTFRPSINCLSHKDDQELGGCGWHGFIEGGQFRDA